MNNWKYEKLSKLCFRIGDGLHGTPEYSEDSDIYFINGNNLKNGKIEINENTKKVTSEELSKNFIELNVNTLLLSINGTLGSMAFFNNEKVMLGKSAAYLNFKTSINKFYYYYFQLPGVQEHFYNVATGSTIKNLSLKSIQDFEVPVPEKNIWQGISKILSSLDAKIELNNKVNAELEAMTKTLYDYWFVQFDFPDANGKPYKTSGGKMVWNEELKREIPEGWEVKRIKDIAETGSGGTPLKSKKEYFENGTIPWINSGEVNASFIISSKKFITPKGLENSSAKLFKKGTILMAMYGATAGQVSLIDIEASTNQAVCGIMPKDKKLIPYLKFGLHQLYDYLINLSSGSARDNLSQDKIKELYFVIPEDELTEKFYKTANSHFKLILKNLKQNQELASLRDWLLPMLMNGQISVGEVENELGMVAENSVEYKKN
ncbi:restriction endonuclease subunit S [Flavobacterium sp.]|uniref:restriction endonuclease subunit S n=1 Tax=Flavobacterium sp. TaxID=239 RepID=UPI00260925D0|nr:restriction endonuclease subunit S [Flavobacterium sp.]